MLLLSTIFFSIVFTVFTPDQTLAAQSPNVIIPIFYVTDRNSTDETFGAARKYPVVCLHEMYYGTALVPLPHHTISKDNSSAQQLGWRVASGGQAPNAKYSKKERIETGKDEENKAQFFAMVAKAVADSGTNRLCIFVHGAAETFEDAAIDAAELAYFMECPTIAYSWPSIGKLKAYHIDEGNCEWSQEHFNRFCQNVETLLAEHPEMQVTLVAHSMGNRLVARATHAMRRTRLVFGDAALVSPDIDAGTFMHYVMHYHSRGVKVRLYVSERDKMLSFAQMMYGGYYRLGEDIGPVLEMLPKIEGPNQAPGQAPMKRRFEKIDFTDLDSKGLGHRLPSALVASMSRTGKPGEGLELVREQVGDGNKLAALARWRFRKTNNLEHTVSGAQSEADKDDSGGSCLRVVNLNRLDKSGKADQKNRN